MKKNDFADIKKMDMKGLLAQAVTIKKEIDVLKFDKNLNSLKNLKSISNKKHDLAQVLTVVRQLEIIETLKGESRI